MENRFLLKRRPAFLLKYNFSAWFCHGLTQKDKVNVAMFGHETQTAEKIFLFISFFLGEKLCLKICTVVDKVIENRFLLKRNYQLFC
jgi:hypothetical protein